jgi:UDP:flavonoid glycosyltransferase YjiC (YdhE family)
MPWEVELIAAARREAHPPAECESEDAFGWRFDALRRELGFAPRTAALRAETYGWSRRRLLVASRHFSEPAPPLAATFAQTGFVFQGRPEDFAPGPALARFMQAGPPPVVLTLSSLVVEHAREFLVMHVRAARAAGCRLLVLGGWTDFTAADLPRELQSGDVLFEPFVPHGWLFPKAAAVVTHGGIGTVARALHAGCPLVIEPFASEQVFNAGRVKALGVGVALHPHRVTVDAVAYALRERLTAESVKRNARVLSRKLAAENGLRNAADAVESALPVEANAA